MSCFVAVHFEGWAGFIRMYDLMNEWDVGIDAVDLEGLMILRIQ